MPEPPQNSAKIPLADDALEFEIVERRDDRSYPIFSIRTHTARHPLSQDLSEYVVVDSPDWVNIIALTDDNEVVLVRQFRHGTEVVTTEIPGGLVDPGETPLEAARRELSEETGYVSSRWIALGSVAPNPAFMSNRCSTFVAANVHLGTSLDLDRTEAIEVRLVPFDQIRSMLCDGEIDHCVVVSAFALFFLKQSAHDYHGEVG